MPVIVAVGNKSDQGTERQVSEEEGRGKAKSLGYDFFEISAKDGSGVEKLFHDVVCSIQRQRAHAAEIENCALRGDCQSKLWASEKEPVKRDRRCVIL